MIMSWPMTLPLKWWGDHKHRTTATSFEILSLGRSWNFLYWQTYSEMPKELFIFIGIYLGQASLSHHQSPLHPVIVIVFWLSFISCYPSLLAAICFGEVLSGRHHNRILNFISRDLMNSQQPEIQLSKAYCWLSVPGVFMSDLGSLNRRSIASTIVSQKSFVLQPIPESSAACSFSRRIWPWVCSLLLEMRFWFGEEPRVSLHGLISGFFSGGVLILVSPLPYSVTPTNG